MIYVKTAAGRQALKDRAETMPRKYHFPFLMCDGVRDSADILAASVQHGFTSVDLYQMVQLGFVEPMPTKVPTRLGLETAPVSAAAESQARPSQQQASVFFDASKLATALSANLGLRGFRLNLAVQTASNLTDLDALLPQLEKALGFAAVKPLADLLKTADR